MSSNARERAAARRAHRRTPRPQGNRAERAARDSGAAAVPEEPTRAELEAEIASEESPPDHPIGDDDQPESDDGQPAEPTVSPNREEITVTLRRRDRQFLEALAAHWDCTPAQCIDRLVRQAHVKMRATTGATMRFSEFQQGDREPD